MTEIKVLIVDDSPFMRKVFSDVIQTDPAFKVLATASNGKEAVDLALELKPDIITMDLEMPHMNGIEALKRIMAIQPTPVIMLSAVTDNGTRDTIRALQYGALDFVRKPDGAVKLDIRQVGEQLLEKLHIALEMMSNGTFRILPAVEERAEPIAQPPPEPIPSPASVDEEAKPPKKPEAERKLVPQSMLEQLIASDKDVQQASKMKNKPQIEAAITKNVEKLRKNDAAIDKRGSRNLSSPSAPNHRTSKIKIPDSLNGKDIPRRQAAKPDSVQSAKEAAVNRLAYSTPLTSPSASPFIKQKGLTTFTHLVAIGTSTGGPRALHEVLTGIPADFPAPILVVQHMPPKFTHSLAQRLDNFCSIHVREAVDGESVETATAYIAPGGKHMSLAREAGGKYRIKLTNEGPRSGHMPSVDVLFESLIGLQKLQRHVVLMTGMGSDGAKGMKALQSDGAATTIAEAEQTCVVYGMPRSAVELGAVSHLLPLQGIAPVIVQEVITRNL